MPVPSGSFYYQDKFLSLLPNCVVFLSYYLRDFSKRGVPDIFVDKIYDKKHFLGNMTNAICTTLLALRCDRFLCIT